MEIKAGSNTRNCNTKGKDDHRKSTITNREYNSYNQQTHDCTGKQPQRTNTEQKNYRHLNTLLTSLDRGQMRTITNELIKGTGQQGTGRV